MAKKHKLFKDGTVTMLYVLSIIFGALYLFGHINQLSDTIIRINSPYFNLDNLLLCLLGILVSLVPLLFLWGHTMFLKLDMYAISAVYFIGNLWIFRWLFEVITTGTVSFDFAAYQLKWYNMFNNTLWASRNAETLMLNYLTAVVWFNMAKNINHDKYVTCLNMMWMFVLTFIAPTLFFGITRSRLIPEWWLQKSVTLVVEYGILFALMFYSSLKKGYWSRYICFLEQSDENIYGDNY